MRSTISLLLLAGCYAHHGRDRETPSVDGGMDAHVDDPDGGHDAGLDAGDLPDVVPTCESGPFEIVRHAVRFDETRPPCPWSVGDNRPLEQAVAAARVEQTHDLMPHEGARLCTLGLDFGPAGTGFRYDDSFFLLFGDVVLAASDRDLVQRLPRDGILRIWDWSAIAGTPMAVVDNVPYCLGEAEGRSRCDIPRTEEAGIARVDFDASLVEELVQRGGPLTVGFVTVGDNDPDLDCAHDAFTFDFVGTYLAP